MRSTILYDWWLRDAMINTDRQVAYLPQDVGASPPERPDAGVGGIHRPHLIHRRR